MSEAAITERDPGRAALEARNWEAARAHYLARCEAAPGAPDLLGLGEAETWLGDNDAALRTLRRAYSAGVRADDLATAASAAILMYFIHRAGMGNLAVARGWLGRLQRLLEREGAEPLTGWVLLLQGDVHLLRGDLDAARALTERSRADAASAGDRDLELCALAQLGEVLVAGGRLDEGLPLLDEAMAGAVTGDEVRWDTVVFASCTTIEACARSAQFARAAEWIRAARRYADAAGGAEYLHTTCRLHYGEVLVHTGRFAEADEELQRAVALARDAEPALCAQALGALARLRIAQGRIEEAGALLVGVEERPGSIVPLAAIALESGDPRAAVVLLRRRLRVLGDRCIEAAEAVDLMGECELAAGAGASVLRRARELRRRGEEVGCALVVAHADRTIGRALYAAGERDGRQAVAHLERALNAFASLEMPLQAARTQLDLADALTSQSPGAAIAEARAAATAFQRLGALRLLDRANRVLRDLGARTGPSGPRSADVLTRREREVLGLLAEGLSNREIAERLYLARKTVEHHVHHVLVKLNLRNRAEAAVYAVRAMEDPPEDR
jgi:DNA-binding NarL/FixJ family response regulator